MPKLNPKKYIVLFTTVTLLIVLIFTKKIFHPSHIFAENFYSSSFRIDFGNLNMTGGAKTSTSFNLTDTVGQNAPGQYDGNSLILKSGFQYIYDSFYPFKFSISNLDIPFGTLVANVGITAQNTLTISAPYGGGYIIYAMENHPLWNEYQEPIPDTPCDTGTCNENTSGPWMNSDTYGFGFNAHGVGTTGIFNNTTQYRQFANINNGEDPVVIASENNQVQDRQTTITYKVNISNLQASGNYQNAIIYIAVPKY